MVSRGSWIDEANEKIKITDVLTHIGVFVDSAILNGGNKKIFCPFGFYHSDGGATKAMRVYLPSNTCYCFSCSKRYSPVSLAAAKWDCSWIAAALRLLEEAGIKPKTIEERWQEATNQLIAAPDTLALAEALKTYCAGLNSDWELLQLDDEVGNLLSRCLALLDSVQTDEDAIKWLQTTKAVMNRKLTDVRAMSN
jgi:hypothetical protein